MQEIYLDFWLWLALWLPKKYVFCYLDSDPIRAFWDSLTDHIETESPWEIGELVREEFSDWYLW